MAVFCYKHCSKQDALSTAKSEVRPEKGSKQRPTGMTIGGRKMGNLFPSSCSLRANESFDGVTKPAGLQMTLHSAPLISPLLSKGNTA